MTKRLLPWLLLLVPLILLAGLYFSGQFRTAGLSRDYVLRLALPDPGDPVDLPGVYGPADRSRPLVVIDAGHGGRDPGASSDGVREKDIVLAYAQALKKELLEEGGIRVALTREEDRFLVLSERFEIARRLGADLFLSIHADSAGDLKGVSGASIYTLSDEASSRAAARFAERENEADVINGVALSEQSEEVSAILVDLSQRRVRTDAAEFARLILREGEGRLVFHPQARRSASLVVLRAPDVPSVLYEAGFVTNPEEAERLTSEVGRETFAQVMARAIRIYFARNSQA